MKLDLSKLQEKVEKYNSILKNTEDYRKKWQSEVKPMVVKTLEHIKKETGLEANIELKNEMENLEVIVLNLGKRESGIKELITDSTLKRELVKSYGALVFQQLFNGKIMIMTVSPHIEGYGDPKPPRTLEIVRPHELTEEFILNYMDEFLKDLINWEDYDDDVTATKAIGFGTQQLLLDEDAVIES